MHNRIQPLIAPLCKECSILIFVGVTLIMNGMMFTHWALPDVTHMPSRRALPEATLKPDRAWKRHFIDRTRPIPSRVRTALYSLHSWLCIGTSDWARGVALLLEWVSIPDCWAWLTSASELAIACLEEALVQKRHMVLPAMELAPLDSSLYPRRLETLCGTESGVLETAQQVA